MAAVSDSLNADDWDLKSVDLASVGTDGRKLSDRLECACTHTRASFSLLALYVRVHSFFYQ